jgi:hypothetical protein
LAHRLVYENEFGPVGKGRHIHHLCGNRACIEPDHLINVTAWEHNNWFGARKAKIKFCIRGHERTPENLQGRHCRICLKEARADAERRAAKAAYDKAYRELNGDRLRAYDRQRSGRKRKPA